MIEGDGYESELQKNAPFDACRAGTPPGGDIHHIRRRLQELGTGHNQSTEYYLLKLQENLLDLNVDNIIAELETSANPRQMSPSFWLRQHVDSAMFNSWDTGSQEAQQDMLNFTVAVLALTFPYHKENRLETGRAIKFYNDYQHEQVSLFGEQAKGVQLSSQMTQTLSWLLDLLHIPHDFTNEEMSIPFSLLERTMQQVSKRYTKPDQEPDHEQRTNIQELMKQWEKQTGGE